MQLLQVLGQLKDLTFCRGGILGEVARLIIKLRDMEPEREGTVNEWRTVAGSIWTAM